MKKILTTIFILLLIAIAVAWLHQRQQLMPIVFSPTESNVPVQSSNQENNEPEVIIDNLSVPWGMAFINENEMLITERTGTVLLYNLENNSERAIYQKPSLQGGEGGLLGITLHPDFNRNTYVYLYDTYELNGNRLNKIDRYTYDDEELSFDRTIINNIPGAKYHDGGRMAFGPDDKLYVTTGDATVPNLAQELNSLAGKILRMNDDGSIPSDNPFTNSFIYSYGHRNPQGLAWDSDGNLWSTEHGPSGLNAGQDELNQILAGGNYGWPMYSGTERPSPNSDTENENLMYPVVASGPDEVWAPAGLAYYDDILYFGGLRGESLYQYDIDEEEFTRQFVGDYGRLRTTLINDGVLYMSTSNTDGRGRPDDSDDKIIQLSL
ncbi:MAG: PQQ-dependent sugar dehydrogenase [Candidatus Pacebacteria bacterium]|nr:PQQ-dependent sugar dehydrogenase [Candidatus Paceibacterota bacterium]